MHGELNDRITLRQGIDAMYVVGLSPAKRQFRLFYYASTPMTLLFYSRLRLDVSLAGLDICYQDYSASYTLAPCTLPFHVKELLFAPNANPKAKEVSVFVNGNFNFTQKTAPSGVWIPLHVGVNTYRLVEQTGVYEGTIIVPAEFAPFPPN